MVNNKGKISMINNTSSIAMDASGENVGMVIMACTNVICFY